MLVGITEALQVTIHGGQPNSIAIPRTSILMGITEALHVTVATSHVTRRHIPGTATLVGVAETLQMTDLGGPPARIPVVQRVDVLAQELETIGSALGASTGMAPAFSPSTARFPVDEIRQCPAHWSCREMIPMGRLGYRDSTFGP